MKPANPRVLTFDRGSSSIKFALFEISESLRRVLEGGVVGIGQPEVTLQVKGRHEPDNFARAVTASDHTGGGRALGHDARSELHLCPFEPGHQKI